MKTLVFAAVFVAAGGSIALAVHLRRRWLARKAAQIDALIKAPIPVFIGADEGLEVRARARREIAEQVRRRSSQIASGTSSTAVLKVMRKA